MGTIAEGTFTIKCDKCKRNTNFPAKESDFECTSGDADRQMGLENIYTWEHSFVCATDGCGNKIEFDYQVSEYPQGTFNHGIPNAKGGKEINVYTFDFSEEPGPDDEV